MKWSTIKLGLPVLLMILFLSGTFVWGQLGTSTIRGTITDSSGAALPGATVTITNLQTNLSRTLTTGSAGTYSFDSIPPGEYKVEVEAKGFRKSVVNRVQAMVGSIAEVSQSLKIGEVKETVLVETTASDIQVNTQDATLGNTIANREINQLPMRDRDVLSLLTLQPGVTQDGYVAGARSDQSNLTLDGVDINDAETNGIGGTALRLNAEAIQEFRVETINSNANEGRSSGAQINLVSKTGTNNWHGAMFEWYRSTLGKANDWFSNRDDVPVAPLVHNLFGGSFGGPIKKDKAFFFYAYEGQREARSIPVTRVVPLANLGQGTIKYSYCVDPSCSTTAVGSLNLAQNQQVYSATGINSTALTALAQAAQKYQANDASVGDGLNTGGFRFNAPVPKHRNNHYARFDFVPTQNQNIFLRMNVIHDHQALAQYLPDSTSPQVWNHPRGIAAGHVWTHGNLVNNARYGFTRQAFTQSGDSTGNDVEFRFVFQPNGQLHTLERITPVHNFTDDVSWTHGKHTWQFGVNIRKINNSRVSFANSFDFLLTNPSFYSGAGETVSDDFQAYLDANDLPGSENLGQSLNSVSQIQNAGTALIGRFSEYVADFTFNKDGSLLAPGAPTVRNFATQAYEGYIQDSWKIKPHLTLTLGLRYSLERPVYETQGFEVQPTIPLGTYFKNRLAAAAQGGNFVDPVIINRSGPANGGKPMYNWDKNNFQPRVAIAWSPSYSDGFLHAVFGDSGKSVIRAGFAKTNDYYGQALAVDWDLNNTLGFTSNFTTPANTYDSNGTLISPRCSPGSPKMLIASRGVPVPPISAVPTDRPRRSHRKRCRFHHSRPNRVVWNLTYERQLRWGTTVSVSYIGRRAGICWRVVTLWPLTIYVIPSRAWTGIPPGLFWKSSGSRALPARSPPSHFSTICFPQLASVMNSTLGMDPERRNAGCSTTWTPTQVFYGMQSRTPSNPFAFFAGNDWTDTQAVVDQVWTPSASQRGSCNLSMERSRPGAQSAIPTTTA